MQGERDFSAKKQCSHYVFFDDYIEHSCLHEGNYISVKKERAQPSLQKIPFPLHMHRKTRPYFRRGPPFINLWGERSCSKYLLKRNFTQTLMCLWQEIPLFLVTQSFSVSKFNIKVILVIPLLLYSNITYLNQCCIQRI